MDLVFNDNNAFYRSYHQSVITIDIDNPEQKTFKELQIKLTKEHSKLKAKWKKSIIESQLVDKSESLDSQLDSSTPYTESELVFIDAIEQGNIDNVNAVLNSAPGNVSLPLTVKIVEKAILNDDYEMLCALLKHYQSLLKSSAKHTELDNLYGCLVECVYTNKPQMTYALVNAIFDSVNGSKEIIFEKLLIESINRGCHLSIIHDIARLWKHSFSISSENAVHAYKIILRKIRSDFDNDSGIYMYTILSLDLLELNSASGKELWNKITPAELEDVIKHKELSNRKTNRPYLNCLLSWDNDVFRLIRWHETKFGLGKHLCSQNAMRPCVAVNKIWQDINSCNEYEAVESHVNEFMTALCRELNKINPLFRCNPNMVGSAKENTKNYHPDEFDYELVFTDIAKLFQIIKFGNVFFFRLLGSIDISNPIHNWLFEFQGQLYLNPDIFKERLNTSIQDILTRAKSCLRTPFTDLNVDIEFLKGDTLFIEPFGFYTKKVKFSCMRLNYFEHSYQLPDISIDLIPTLECDISIKVPKHMFLNDYDDMTKLHIIMYGDPVGFQLGFSGYENHIINRLPQNLKEGYRMAKAVRGILSLCHGAKNKFERLKNECSVERITTYMLKTMVVIMTSKGITKEELSMTPCEWACKIYEKLQNFLEKDKRIPNYFLNEANREGEECLFQIEFNRKHLKERERLDMIEAINKIICGLRAMVRRTLFFYLFFSES